MKEQEKHFAAGGAGAGAAVVESDVSPHAAAAAARGLALPPEAGGGDETGGLEDMGDALAAALTEMEERFETVSTAILNRLDDMSSKVDELEQQLQSLISTTPQQQQDADEEGLRHRMQQQQELDQINFGGKLAVGKGIAGTTPPQY